LGPALAVGVTDRLWKISDIVEMLDGIEAKEKREARSLFGKRCCAATL